MKKISAYISEQLPQLVEFWTGFRRDVPAELDYFVDLVWALRRLRQALSGFGHSENLKSKREEEQLRV